MFTGLVQDTGEVAALERDGDTARLRVRASLAGELTSGASVSVNGVCLTAIDLRPDEFSADLSSETIERSTLGGLAIGARLNLELAVRAQDRLGGHIVQGHVDGVGTFAAVTESGDGRELRVEAPPELLRYVVEKGSITVDGVSLTANGVDQSGFSVSLIPETLQRTNLGEVKIGDRANLEVDLIAKYVEKLVEKT